MNDFTKEELSTLFKCVRISEMEYGECKELDYVKLKLKSMIDGCCRHQDDGLCYYTNPPQAKCVKCGEFYR